MVSITLRIINLFIRSITVALPSRHIAENLVDNFELSIV
ncbi:hypothetical protein BFJ70_g3406 [Fusarium oxysporum]|nr:hypothetical protein BFJ70_g3406 [Fusarium oxysporum]